MEVVVTDHVAVLALRSHLLSGLTTEEVAARREENGPNVLPEEKAVSAWSILLAQLKSPLIYIILTAALISLAARELGDFAIIMAVVVIDVALGFVQEYQAERTYTALKTMLKPTTTVVRNGMRQEIELWELVPGDLALLNAGEHVPGDGELIESASLTVDEAILTGESEPVNKAAADMTGADGSSPTSGLFMGTTVLTGHAVMQVTATGPRTELGQIAVSLQEHVDEDTPLQAKLKTFSRTFTYIVVGFTAAILCAGLLMGRPFLDMLRTSIILAVAAVPEGLLIAVTVILALGMRRILRRNGLVKRLLAVETLGSVTVICTDKTGTLTEGRMRVTKADLPNRESALEAMVLCNNLEGPVEVALWEYARSEMGRDPQELADQSTRVAEELFSSETKYMSTAVHRNGDYGVYLKGAPEIVLGMCSMAGAEEMRVMARVDEWAGEGLRLLGLAHRQDGSVEDHKGYTWAGLVGMEDPVRAGVPEAVAVAQRAGIRVKMITGDYRRTAERIAANIGILQKSDEVLEGQALADLTDEELRERVRHCSIFSRIRPKDKLRIIKALQADGEVTAMIGDGVNDAPALKRANIGVVVGSASDLAKETADLILLDDNFSTVVAAVEEGRVIFANIRKVVAYVLSNSFAEVLAIFGAMLLGWPAPLLVAQILWIHLICDGPSDIVLGFEPKEAGIMDERPRSMKEPILTPLSFALIALISGASALGALWLFGHYANAHGDAAQGRSIVFASFAVNTMIYIFGYRSLRRPLFRMTPLRHNKPLVWSVIGGLLVTVLPFAVRPLGRVLGIVPLSLGEWGLVFGVAFALLAVVEVGKRVSGLHRAQRAAPTTGPSDPVLVS